MHASGFIGGQHTRILPPLDWVLNIVFTMPTGNATKEGVLSMAEAALKL